MPEMHADLLGGTPIFTIAGNNSAYERVTGSVYDKPNDRWIFPAYPPFGQMMIDDLRKVAPDVVPAASAAVQIAQLADLPRKLRERVLTPGFQFPTKPYEHQIDGLVHMYHHPRFALFWDCGTGKSFVVINLLRLLKGQRALIFGPRTIVMNWVNEIQRHAGGELKVGVLRGSPAQKHKVIANYQNYDVIISGYGTARTMAYPKLCQAAIKAIVAASETQKFSARSLKELARVTRLIGDADFQMDYVASFALGMPLAAIERHARAEAAKKPQYISDIDYQIIIADESQCIKEATSQQTKVIVALSKQADRRYLMSGTPALGDPRHLYPQMQFLSPAIIPEHWFQFLDTYLVRSAYNKHIVVGFKNMSILNTRVQRVSISKRKDECLDLPPRIVSDIFVDVSAKQKALYNETLDEFSIDLEAHFKNPSSSQLEVQHAAVLVNKLAQISSGFVMDNHQNSRICDACPHVQSCVPKNILPYTSRCLVKPEPPAVETNFLDENPKLDALNDLLDSILANPLNKVIVWGVFHPELNLIENALKLRDVGYVRVDGNTSNRIQAHVKKFNEDKDCRVYLGQEATGVGITLNAATYMIYFSFDWSLDHYYQSIDRNYRAGQTEKTTVYRLICKHSIDEYKAIALSQKRTISLMLTSKIGCITCVNNIQCMQREIKLFDPECLFKPGSGGTVTKFTANVRMIP